LLIFGAVVGVAAEVEALLATFAAHPGAEPEPETGGANPMARSTNPR
jgi:hypothetical protein